MKPKPVLVIIALLVFPGHPQRAEAKRPTSLTCSQVSLARPGVGSAYIGMFRNGDYNFSVRIPHGITAWSGVADGAPFHGFEIFLDPKLQACIVLEIHIRIPENSPDTRDAGGETVQLGKANGRIMMSTGLVNGIKMERITTAFSFKQPDQTDDGEILLITPSARSIETKRIYDALVRSLSFGY